MTTQIVEKRNVYDETEPSICASKFLNTKQTNKQNRQIKYQIHHEIFFVFVVIVVSFQGFFQLVALMYHFYLSLCVFLSISLSL